MSIAENIKHLRETHGLNQTEFGKIAGVSDKAVSTWENGIKTPRMGAVQRLADYFGIPKSAILDEPFIEDIEEPSKSAQQLSVLARHLDKIPEDMRNRLVKNFSDTIDDYLDVMGIPKEDEG